MVITVEISMYPFQEKYRDLIQDFVTRLNGYEELSVTRGPTSTVIVGEYECVMECFTEMLRWSHSEQGRAVFVTKFIPDYEPD